MKEIMLYPESALREAFHAGSVHTEGNPHLWEKVFKAGERKGSSYLNEAIHAPNWIQFMHDKKRMFGMNFPNWIKSNKKRIGIYMDNERFLKAATESEIERVVGKRLITLGAVENIVSDVFDITINKLRYANTRERTVTAPRQAIWYIAYFHCHDSLQEIGERIGGRGHATVINGAKRMAGHASVPGKERKALREIYKRLTAQGYDISHYVQDDNMPSRTGVTRMIVKPVEIEL